MAISYLNLTQDKNFNFNIEDNDLFLSKIITKYTEDKISNPCSAFNNLIESLLSLARNQTFSSKDYFQLITEIDSSEIYNYNSLLFGDEESAFKTYESLNYLFKDKIRIYPILLSNYREKLNSIYKKDYNDNYLRDRKIYNAYSINSKLSNYIFYPINEYSYNITIHELTEYEDFIKHISEKREIKVALLPITSINILDLLNIKYTKQKIFYTDLMDSHIEQNIVNRCKNSL